MKFLCVPCDEPMVLDRTEGPEAGSLAVVFACPRCPNRVAMLTNPWETQLVRALDVRLGGPDTTGAPMQFVRSTLAKTRVGLEVESPTAGTGTPVMHGQSANSATGQSSLPECQVAGSPGCQVIWSPEAQERLERVPSFARTMVREGIERFARQHGHDRITNQVMDEARQAMGT